MDQPEGPDGSLDRACATCGRELIIVATGGERVFGYAHAPSVEATHAPLPAMLEVVREVSPVCDFCFHATPVFVLPIADVAPCAMVAANNQAQPMTNWAACADCGEFLTRGDWTGLRARVVARYQRQRLLPEVDATHMDEVLAGMYEVLATYQLGPLRPVGQQVGA